MDATFAEGILQWTEIHSLGRKVSTQKFNGEICQTILEHWPFTLQLCETITADEILAFGQKVSHYCPSRWNAFVSAMRFISPHGNHLAFRAVQMREFTPPGQSQFKKLLSECDAAPRSKAGLFVRFLCLTGMRITEARGIKWVNVFPDRIDVPAAVAKSGKRRSIPLLDGLSEVLERLRSIRDGSEFVLPRENARKAIQSACVRAGVVNMSHHDFRHYFATRCIESGVDIPTLARWLGHQDGGALLSRTYFHLLDGHSYEMAARVKIAA